MDDRADVQRNHL